MKKLAHYFVLLAVGVLPVLPVKAQDKAFINDKVSLLWATQRDMDTPESVFYDQQKDLIYVANIGGQPADKDGNGFISVLKPDGSIKNLKWVTGLNGPKGMGITNGHLYVSDIDRVAEIDLASGKITKFYPADGAKFLNDITTAPNGEVYISDSKTNTIYRISKGEISVFFRGDQLKGINGLFFQDGYLLAGLANSIVKIDPATTKMVTLVNDTGGIDGLMAAGKGYYIISDWSGHIHLVAPGKKKILVMDTTPDKVNAADIFYVPEKKLLLVPTFFDNRIMAYKVDIL